VGRGTEVGVDVEVVAPRNVPVEVAERFFSAAEVAHLRACADGVRDVRFTELWTLKEAYIKAVGTGLSHPLDTFSVLPDGPAGLRFEAPAGVDAASWQFALLAPSARHRLAVAVHRTTEKPCRIVMKSDYSSAYLSAPSPIRM
jgi:4'-phosphopantetheinyl transferase